MNLATTQIGNYPLPDIIHDIRLRFPVPSSPTGWCRMAHEQVQAQTAASPSGENEEDLSPLEE